MYKISIYIGKDSAYFECFASENTLKERTECKIQQMMFLLRSDSCILFCVEQNRTVFFSFLLFSFILYPHSIVATTLSVRVYI